MANTSMYYMVVNILTEEMNIKGNKLSPNDNLFFDLGMDSLDVVIACELIETKLNWRSGMIVLPDFDYRKLTLQNLVDAAENAKKQELLYRQKMLMQQRKQVKTK